MIASNTELVVKSASLGTTFIAKPFDTLSAPNSIMPAFSKPT